MRLAVAGAAVLLAACTTSETTVAVPVAPDSGVTVRLAAWENQGDTALIEVELENQASEYSQFVVDAAVTDATGRKILAYAPLQLNATAGSAAVMATASVAGPVPADARVGVANVWGRVPGDEQIHTIELLGEPSVAAIPPPTDWSADQTLAVAQEFAARFGTVQQQCRAEQSVAGLACLSRRNFPANLLPESATDFLTVVPYFSEPEQPEGPPRAFEFDDGTFQACVGQRIDKQTSAQVAIAGSCSQRGLFPGFGDVVAVTAARTVAPAAGTATPTWSGTAAPLPPPTADQRTDIGTPFPVGRFTVTVEGVQVGLESVATTAGVVSATAGFTILTIVVGNPGSSIADAADLRFAVLDGDGTLLTAVQREPLAVTALGVLQPGTSSEQVRIYDLPNGVTATTLIVTDGVTGEAVEIGLLPPVA